MGVPEVLKQPWAAFVVPTASIAILFAVAIANEDLSPLCLGLILLISAVAQIIVVVQAFREGIGTGVACLCLPAYIIYWVVYVNESPHVKALFAAGILGAIAIYLSEEMGLPQ